MSTKQILPGTMTYVTEACNLVWKYQHSQFLISVHSDTFCMGVGTMVCEASQGFWRGSMAIPSAIACARTHKVVGSVFPGFRDYYKEGAKMMRFTTSTPLSHKMSTNDTN
eukprot:4911777-Amphidinium_carterae.1